MVIARNLASTEDNGIPYSAISISLVDYKPLPGKMPARRITCEAHASGKSPVAARCSDGAGERDGD